MNRTNAAAYKWLVKRVSEKTKISVPNVKKMLGAISDLRWDWRNSKYDIYGLQIQEMLEELGEERCPDPELL